MKQGIVIRDKKAILIVMIIFVSMVSLITSCSTAPKKVWSKPGFTEAEFTKDKNRCLQQAQGDSPDMRIHPTGAFCLDYYCEYDETQNAIVINWKLFNTCMEEQGWSLVEKKQQ